MVHARIAVILLYSVSENVKKKKEAKLCFMSVVHKASLILLNQDNLGEWYDTHSSSL